LLQARDATAAILEETSLADAAKRQKRLRL
jgi:hypothetical protein